MRKTWLVTIVGLIVLVSAFIGCVEEAPPPEEVPPPPEEVPPPPEEVPPPRSAQERKVSGVALASGLTKGLMGDRYFDGKWKDTHTVYADLFMGGKHRGWITFTFSEDYKHIDVNMALFMIKNHVDVDWSHDNHWTGTQRVAGMTRAWDLQFTPGSMSGDLGGDQCYMKFDPPLKKGEIPELDFLQNYPEPPTPDWYKAPPYGG
jgi:hypothetical protein